MPSATFTPSINSVACAISWSDGRTITGCVKDVKRSVVGVIRPSSPLSIPNSALVLLILDATSGSKAGALVTPRIFDKNDDVLGERYLTLGVGSKISLRGS